jgi:hypothetical protein
MTNDEVTEPNTTRSGNRPRAVGFVRSDVSGPASARHTTAVQRHALALGYQCVYTCLQLRHTWIHDEDEGP